MDLEYYYSAWSEFKELSIVNDIHNVDVWDIASTMSKIKSLPAGTVHMVIEDPSVSTKSANADHAEDLYSGAILLLQSVGAKSCNADNRNKLLIDLHNRCQNVKKTLISKKQSNQALWNGLVIGSFEMNKVGPISESLYGWRLQFDIKSLI